MNIRAIEPTIVPDFTRQKVAAYARVSTGKDEQLESVAAQIDYFKRLIQSQPLWEFAGVFADEDISGTKAERPEFRRLLELCRQGKIDRILTKSISRFARNTVDLLTIVRELRALQIEVCFEREKIDTLSSDGELLLTLLASFAQEESRSISLNKRWSVQKQFEQGEIVGVAHLYGYDILKGELVINSHEAEIVHMIVQDYLAGSSSKTIADKLNLMGEKRKGGGFWKPHDISLLFKNEKLTGNAILQKTFKDDAISPKLHRNKGQKPKFYAEGTHEGILTADEFAVLRMEVEKRTSKPKTKPDPVHPFRGHIVCGQCGAPFNRKKTKTCVFWRCARNLGMREGHCSIQGVPEQELERMVASALPDGSFTAQDFNAQIDYLEVLENHQVRIVLKTGEKNVQEWKERSRAESWTAEMRAEASKRDRERREKR